jgi:hypothetical protein
VSDENLWIVGAHAAVRPRARTALVAVVTHQTEEKATMTNQLDAAAERLRQKRRREAEAVVESLRQQGMEITADEVDAVLAAYEQWNERRKFGAPQK